VVFPDCDSSRCYCYYRSGSPPPPALHLGVEFTSGTLLRFHFDQPVSQSELREALSGLGYTDVVIQNTSGGDYYVRTREITTEERQTLETGLADKLGKVTETGANTVSPLAAAQTVRVAIIAVAIAAAGILLYISWAFRKMPNPFRYGVSAVATLLFDVLMVLGTFAILGSFLGWEVNLVFITGILGVIGYSINNCVIIFDRIRENQLKGVSPDFAVVVNNSIVETLGRCLNTNITTLFPVLVNYVFL